MTLELTLICPSCNNRHSVGLAQSMCFTGSSLYQNWGQHKGFTEEQSTNHGITTSPTCKRSCNFLTRTNMSLSNISEVYQEWLKLGIIRCEKNVGQDPASSWKTGSWNFHLRENQSNKQKKGQRDMELYG